MADATIATKLSRLRGFDGGAREIDDAPVEVRGELPPWLRGSLLLNGPALWELPRGRLEHWFDGYAMFHRIALGDGAPRYRSRFAQSDSYRRSVAAGAPVSGEFGTANPAGLLARIKGSGGTDNPAVVMSRHGDRWVATTETPHLTYFDARTLQTEERLDLAQTELRAHLMAAHGITLADGSYLNLAVTLGPKCELKLFRLRPGSTRPEVIARIVTPKAGYTHAFALAPGHAIVWECALRVNLLGLRFGARSYAENFRWEAQGGSSLHAIDLASGKVRSWKIAPMMAFHATQAWSEGDDLLVELAAYDDAAVFDDLRLDRRRAQQPLRAGLRRVCYRMIDGRADATMQTLGHPIELQQVHPARIGTARASVCWGAANAPDGTFNDRTIRIDLDRDTVKTWQRPSAHHLEPLFVPRPGGESDDDGVLLVPTLADGDETTVVGVVDAATMQCIGELRLPQVVPFGFHAAFAVG